MRSAFLSSGLALVLVILSPLGLLPAPRSVVRAADYQMRTAASYAVDPEAGEVRVRIEVTFRNTTPNPEDRFSLFEVVDLAIHEGAEDVGARDARGRLNVSVADEDGFTLAVVRPREGVRYRQRTRFTLTYRLPDAATSQVRIRPTVVAFPVWSFGTVGEVSVRLPAAYEVSVAGSDLEAERAGRSWVLDSGSVANPGRWLALLTAVGPASYEMLTRAVPLGSGTVDLQVRAFADDEGWGRRTLTLVASALPRLEEHIGLPYPDIGPLEIVESVRPPGDAFGEPTSSGTQLLAGFDADPFTILHQVAHVWLSEDLATDRWIREGFASLAAEAAAGATEVDLPFDPAARTRELTGDAFPLASWGAGGTGDAQEAYAYAASWMVARRLEVMVGTRAMRLAWERTAAGIDPYQTSTDPTAPSSPNAVPVDSRALLDQLAAVSDADVAPIFEELVFDDATAAQLPARAEARAALEDLLVAAGGWGAPDPVVTDLVGWRFEEAMGRMAEAGQWLRERDALVAEAELAGLSVPQRLRDRYVSAGGGPEARAELEAERAVVATYREGQARMAAGQDPLERVGLLGGPQPGELLADAAVLFGDGELRGALEAAEAAVERLERASAEGAVRLVAAGIALLLLLALALRLVRSGSRRGEPSGSDYTAAG